jgi:hypothetical protein
VNLRHKQNCKSAFSFRLLIVLILGFWGISPAQEGSKSIKSEEYLTERPTGTASGGKTSSSAVTTPRPQGANNRARPKPGRPAQAGPTSSFVYLVDKDFPEGPPPRNFEYVRVAVTIWRLSPTQCPIQNCPLPAARAESSKGLIDTATRVEDDVPLNNGERVRIALESLSHSGYIYVIDREQFSDGSLGEPVLIFPTQKIDNGKNWAVPGLQIHLPRANGCFCVKSRNLQKTLAADLLTVILSPTPLIAPQDVGADAIPLPTNLISFLNRPDREKTFRAILRGGSGLAQSAQEQSAGAKGLFDTEAVLTQADLPPQNFYQGLVPKGKAAVFTFLLHYGHQ